VTDEQAPPGPLLTAVLDIYEDMIDRLVEGIRPDDTVPTILLALRIAETHGNADGDRLGLPGTQLMLAVALRRLVATRRPGRSRPRRRTAGDRRPGHPRTVRPVSAVCEHSTCHACESCSCIRPACPYYGEVCTDCCDCCNSDHDGPDHPKGPGE
jgi:hypothetical protein